MADGQDANIPSFGTPHPLIVCSACNHPFVATVHEKPLPGGGIRQYLECPECVTPYPICDITDAGLRIRQRLQRLAQLGQMRTPQYRQLHNRYRAEVTRLAAQENADDRTPVSAAGLSGRRN